MSMIIWLASYPKSGNTWFRVFLDNLLQKPAHPISINKLSTTIASSRLLFEEHAGIESANLTTEEILSLRPKVYEAIAEKSLETVFLKTHDLLSYNEDGIPLISQKATSGVLYFIRNPLDVCISFAHHSNWSIDTSITQIENEGYALCGRSNALDFNLREHLSSWRKHVLSWVDAQCFRIHVVRYEDMLTDTFETFQKAVAFAGLSNTEQEIAKAIEFSSFDQLKRQEDKQGFREKNPASISFFRKGKIGSWREILNQEQVDRIVNAQRDVMQRFGYLTEDEQIVY
jgi:hypothetical protein